MKRMASAASGGGGGGSNRLICGIDETGRGSLFGPLVVGGVVIPEHLTGLLRDMGVRDSKKVAPKKRLALHEFLTTHEEIGWATTHVTSQEIDLRRRRHESLNEVEASAMMALARRLQRERPFAALQLDSIENDAERFARPFAATFLGVEVLAQCGADETHVAVSAASIVAKVERDAAVAGIARDEGMPLGSGYPGDPLTKTFLALYYRAHGCLPPYIRHTWNIEKSWEKEG
jgi:ribonuclease HII